MKLIGLTGLRGSGKSTVANILCTEYGWIELSFANPLKKGLQEMFQLESKQLFGPDKEQVDDFWGVTPRELLQVIGTELFREILPQKLPYLKGPIWLKACEKELLKLKDNPNIPGIVISDVRFLDEVNLIRSYNGKILHVLRDSQKTSKWNLHSSEMMAANYKTFNPDYIIKNNKTIEALKKKLSYVELG